MNGRGWHYRFSIKTKILVLALAISLSSIVLMGLLTSYSYTESAKNDFYLIAQDSTSRINHQLDRYFGQMAQSTYASIAGPLPTNPLLGSNPESGMIQEWLKNGGLFSREQQALVEGILSRYIAINDSHILGIVLRSLDDRLVYSKDNEISPPMNASAPWLTAPLSRTLQVVPSYYSRDVEGKAAAYPFIALVIPVFDPNTLKLAGNLYLALSISEVQSILGQARLGETGYFFIVDAEGGVVYHPDLRWVGRALADTPLREIRLTERNDLVRLNGARILTSNDRSDATGWRIVAYVPLNELATGLAVARKFTLFLMAGMILLSLLIIPRMISRAVRPVIRLSGLMKRVEQGDLTVRAEAIPGRDEIQHLNGSFNRMTARLSELMHTVRDLQLNEMSLQLMQRDAHIQALQNQINPHLLYNTLEIIKSIAFIEKVPSIEKMAANLASVYRYASKMPGSEVPLREELRNLRDYLNIVRIRFLNKFESEIAVDEANMDWLVIKLTLQPIVENSVKYAVEPKNGNAGIRIQAYEEGGDLLLEVADDGNGFPEEALQSLNARMRAIEREPAPFVREESVGILNVHARLVLNYGVPYGVRIRSKPGEGSVVSVRYPRRADPTS
ncbi:cache domain-containing sensor histidine kinase [Cohnella nanjingensis]|uniref:Sensor histidine kinase n=1 Tax=Cohnella nanjingensis TaxID=1387779 RepID=A0A7X0RVH4_9BACL|nr:sensor histidine kinase [Cohnella nanjingensis]MBB6674432.1 sensor histidine kinase [Cohnella nanjingensis]